MDIQYYFYIPLALFALWILQKFFKTAVVSKSATLGENSRNALASYVNASLSLSGGQIVPNLAFPILTQSQQFQSLDVCVGQKIVSKRSKSIWRFRESQSLVQSFSLLFGTESQCEILLEANSIDDANLFANAIVQTVNFEKAEISVKCRIRIIVQSQIVDFSHTEMAEMEKLSYVDGKLRIDLLPVSLSLSVNLSPDKIKNICSMISNSSLMCNA